MSDPRNILNNQDPPTVDIFTVAGAPVLGGVVVVGAPVAIAEPIL